ncbi:DUF6518 family protein [Actinoplanes sp. URMC 104]|uniref:DUF6518 family protein n=1 Tax=Actinoplanes sp. URMC 104 TaxID=3423409 RepID=UPI003F1B6522
MSFWLGRVWWVGVALIAGMLVGSVDSVVNHVPVFLGEVSDARAERGSWSQVAEFASLILDAGWAWAALAVLTGWLASRNVRPVAGSARAAVAGGLSLMCATAAYYGTDLLFDGGTWWGWVTRYWLIGSVVLGPPLGVAGALIRRGGAVGAVAACVVPVGAALQMVLLPPTPESRMAEPVQWSVWFAAVITIGLIACKGGRRPRTASPVEPV